MSYEVAYTPDALSRIPDSLPQAVLKLYESRVREMAQDPAKFSEPAPFPFPPKGMLYHFNFEYDRVKYRFNVFFFYSSDECSIIIHAVTCSITPRK